MPTYRLSPHPEHQPLTVRGVKVDVRGSRDGVLLSYQVTGAENVITPEQQSPARTDELWRTTCFELFLRLDDDERYVEFNFSPSTCWAAYAFDGYREGMAELEIVPPDVERRHNGVVASLDLSGLPHGEFAMALTAVIEEKGGIKSYWSLAHPPGAPDFHHAACFVARLPAPGRA